MVSSSPLTKDSCHDPLCCSPRYAFAMLAAPALAVEFEPNDQGFTEFNMPSGNIGCFYVPAGGTDVYKTSDGGAELSCDRVEPSYVRVMLGSFGQGRTHHQCRRSFLLRG